MEALLLGWGIAPLHLITGQGHHFVWRVGLQSAVGRAIAALAPIHPDYLALKALYAATPKANKAARNLDAFVSDDYALVKSRPLDSEFVACGPRFVFEDELREVVEQRMADYFRTAADHMVNTPG